MLMVKKLDTALEQSSAAAFKSPLHVDDEEIRHRFGA
jgi:hypothetical protein